MTRGFTLIELLVVVAIIALLISILLPSLNRAKAPARQLICVSNLRSQGEAASFYRQENQDYLPRGIQGWAMSEEYHIFATAIINYLGNDPVNYPAPAASGTSSCRARRSSPASRLRDR